MPFFNHRGNRQILWNALSPSELFGNFGNLSDRTKWFNQTIDSINERNSQNMSAEQLNDLNCNTVKYILNKIQVNVANNSKNNYESLQPHERNKDGKAYDQERNTIVNEFEDRRKQYEIMITPPPPSPISFEYAKDDTSLNLSELLDRQIKSRVVDMDFHQLDMSQDKNAFDKFPHNNINIQSKPINTIAISNDPVNISLTDVVSVGYTSNTLSENNDEKSVSWNDSPSIYSNNYNNKLMQSNNIDTIDMDKLMTLMDNINLRTEASTVELNQRLDVQHKIILELCVILTQVNKTVLLLAKTLSNDSNIHTNDKKENELKSNES